LEVSRAPRLNACSACRGHASCMGFGACQAASVLHCALLQHRRSQPLRGATHRPAGSAPRPPSPAPPAVQRAAAKTAVHQSLELLLECRWVAYHTPLQALTLTHCTSCPPLGQLQALERLRLQCCGYPDAPLALPFDILRLKRLRSLGEAAVAGCARTARLASMPLCSAPPVHVCLCMPSLWFRRTLPACRPVGHRPVVARAAAAAPAGAGGAALLPLHVPGRVGRHLAAGARQPPAACLLCGAVQGCQPRQPAFPLASCCCCRASQGCAASTCLGWAWRLKGRNRVLTRWPRRCGN
jgi:hypothetical protein